MSNGDSMAGCGHYRFVVVLSFGLSRSLALLEFRRICVSGDVG